ncbi:MAG: UDP-2,4-diacetamido-2,4,6-trideoxy-beta-L-altropyranose hydrolase [Spirochaetia bacterium]|nr:UDP-2,4-diacetamido-2,4,6-trideoxy-beta-L-altropyranose hydrolase [Spirochaetia bacterium]
MKIIFRADASVEIGTGHVMRCLTLAEALKEKQAEVEFICLDLPGNLASFIKTKAFAINMVSNNLQALSILEEKRPDWLIIDNYDIDESWEKKTRPFVKKIMVIDDLANRKHDCDILLDQNYGAEELGYEKIVPPNCKLLLGPKYALLRKEFLEARDKIRQDKNDKYEINKIMIFMGGSDPENITEKALDAVLDFNLHIDVVIGASNPHKQKLEKKIIKYKDVVLHTQISNMAEIMANADLCIGAGGSATWERFCIGLPAITVITAENQRVITEKLSSVGLVENLGWNQEVTHDMISSCLQKMIYSSHKLYIMSDMGMKIVDGKGTKKVGNEILQNEEMKEIFLREAQPGDIENIFKLSNDPDVREVSINKEKISWEDHVLWYKEKINDINTLLLAVENGHSSFLGQVRFDIMKDMTIISISLIKEERGKGLGLEIIKKACNYFFTKFSKKKIKAYINPDNISSIKVFQKAGFIQHGEEIKNQNKYLVFYFEKTT